MSTVAEIKKALSHLSLAERIEIEDWLSEHPVNDTRENIARIQRKLDEVDPSNAREWTEEDWGRLGVRL